MATGQFPKVGERFLDRYQITKLLGAGGMSRVYGAVQDGIDRKVAIKLLAPANVENLTVAALDRFAARFEREARIISKFKSPHTVVIYNYGRSKDHLYMILEWVEGTNLHELVGAMRPLPVDRVVRILRQALASLSEAHGMGVLHRDIKPQNIMVFENLAESDFVKVLDFGLAKAFGGTLGDATKLTAERTILGTPSYMSPEQIMAYDLTPASDLYSLGLVAYELLFGIAAIEADSAVSTMARHLAPTPIEIPDDKRIPRELLAILRRMIAKPVDERYATASEVLADLAAWDEENSGATVPRSRLAQASPWELSGREGASAGSTERLAVPGTDGKLPVTSVQLFIGVVIVGGVALSLAASMSGDDGGEVAAVVETTEKPEVEVSVASAEPSEPSEPSSIEEPAGSVPTSMKPVPLEPVKDKILAARQAAARIAVERASADEADRASAEADSRPVAKTKRVRSKKVKSKKRRRVTEEPTALDEPIKLPLLAKPNPDSGAAKKDDSASEKKEEEAQTEKSTKKKTKEKKPAQPPLSF